MNIRRAQYIVVATVVVLVATGTARAQICGDPDGAGSITVSDGVQVLQAAASLASDCTAAVCDVDGSGAITVTDGVLVLRRAAALPATLTCGTEVSDFVSNVEGADGTQAVLEIGAAPIPGPDAPTTIGQVTGPQTVTPGGSNTVDVPFDTAGAGAAQVEPPVFVLAIADTEGQFFDGFYELPLDAEEGTQTITIELPANLGTQSFLLCPATRVNGELSNYGIYRQDPVTTVAGTTRSVSFTVSPSTTDVSSSVVHAQEVSS